MVEYMVYGLNLTCFFFPKFTMIHHRMGLPWSPMPNHAIALGYEALALYALVTRGSWDLTHRDSWPGIMVIGFGEYPRNIIQ